MEPNKFEKEFREKLEKRTIQPSEMAWDRLDAMLSVAEKKKPNRAWMYMAASFLVFATLGVFFINQGDNNETIIKQDSVVNREQPAPVNPVRETESVKPETIVVKQEAEIAAVSGQIKAAQKIQTTVSKTDKIIMMPANNEAVAQTTIQEPVKVIAESEVEQLVAEAIEQETPKNKLKVTVDPNSLLSSVEGELDESFRNKAFQGVVKNFNAVKTAVANRNYQ